MQVRAGVGAGVAHEASIFMRGAHLDPDGGEGLVRESRAQPGGEAPQGQKVLLHNLAIFLGGRNPDAH